MNYLKCLCAVLFILFPAILFAGSGILEVYSEPSEDARRAEEKRLEEERRNRIGAMVFVKGGCFRMGEKPFDVCVSDFYIDRTEVTEGAYKEVMGRNTNMFTSCGDECPVGNVTWYHADEFCRKAGKRLPNEAEWEYAARSGGKMEKWAGTNNESELGEYGWFRDNSDRDQHAVAQKLPNGFGLYDMSGNVSEWVSDLYYGVTIERVLRGGAIDSNASRVSTSHRSSASPDYSSFTIGIRCAKTP